MKYYAVTEDPRELFHYGVKGMKWGKHLFGDDLRPKSTGYKRALSKLRSAAQKTAVATGKVARTTAKAAKATGGFLKRSAIQTSYAVRQAQDNKYNRAVQRAQKRMNLSSAMRSLDRDSSVYRQENLDHKREALLNRQYDIKAHNDYKQLKSSVRAERSMPKYMQQAREGTLRYGRLSEEQIGRIQDRLNWENQARRVGGTEEPSWKEQKKQARRQGYLQGITRGTGAAMEEVARAGVQIASKRILDKQNAQRAEREKASNRIRNKRTDKEIREDLKTEAYEAELKSGKSWYERQGFGSHMRVKQAADSLQNKEQRNQARYIQNEVAKDRALTEARDAYNDERQEKQFLEAAKDAYEYGYIPSYLTSGNSGGGKGKKGKGNNGGQNQNKPKIESGNPDAVKELADYYKQRYVKNETLQQKAERKKLEARQEEERKKLEEQQKKVAERQAENEKRAHEIIENRKKQEEAARISDQKEKERYREGVAKLLEEAATAYGERQAAKSRGEQTDITSYQITKNEIADQAAAAYRQRQAEREAAERASLVAKLNADAHAESRHQAEIKADQERRNKEREERLKPLEEKQRKFLEDIEERAQRIKQDQIKQQKERREQVRENRWRTYQMERGKRKANSGVNGRRITYVNAYDPFK